jgi:hypothetical protein
VSDHTPEAIEAIPDRFVQVFDGEALDPAVLAERTAYTRGQRDTQARRYTTTVKAVAQTLADTDARTDGQATYRDMATALLVPGGPLEDTNTEWEYGWSAYGNFTPAHSREYAERVCGDAETHSVVRRRPAGPWVVVPHE